MSKGILRLALLFCALLLMEPSAGVMAQQETSYEYKVKAAYICNFARFVEWPSEPSGTSGEPLIIGILGNNPFGEDLEATIKDKKIRGRKIVIRQISEFRQLYSCHILFVGQSEDICLSELLQKLKGRSILTIGETKKFSDAGGMIRFVLQQNKVRFEINPKAAKEAGLKVSSQLLKLAVIVSPGK